MKKFDTRSESGSEARIEPYKHPAAGWGALKYVAINLIKEKVTGGNYRTLLKQNQPDGFDCPGCAWPDDLDGLRMDFCENGVKHLAWELTGKRVERDFFERRGEEDGGVGVLPLGVGGREEGADVSGGDRTQQGVRDGV